MTLSSLFFHSVPRIPLLGKNSLSRSPPALEQLSNPAADTRDPPISRIPVTSAFPSDSSASAQRQPPKSSSTSSYQAEPVTQPSAAAPRLMSPNPAQPERWTVTVLAPLASAWSWVQADPTASNVHLFSRSLHPAYPDGQIPNMPD